MPYKVGLIGVGAMGKALLHRMNLAGMTVKAYDVAESGMKAAQSMGAAVVSSPAAASEDVDFVHLFVRTDEEELDATLGKDGIFSALGSESILLLHSTVLPETTLRVGEIAAARNLKLMDAPVTAVPRHLFDGEGVFLTGGAPDVEKRARPHLEALGRAMYYFGPLGTGNVAKLAKNLATAIERLALAEVVWLAEGGGLDPEFFLKMMRNEHIDPLIQRWPDAFRIENGHAIPKPATNLLNKDVRLATVYAQSRGVKAPIAATAADVADDWVAGWERKKN